MKILNFIRRSKSHKKGFTLVETLISCLLIAIGFLSFEAIMYMQQYFISYPKHKLQAIHAARAVLDMVRLAGFPTANQQFPLSADLVYTGCDISNATVTISVLPPHNDSACNYRETVQVRVSWNEIMCGVTVTKQEFLTTDIAHEPELN